jgi:hypothetical protein
MSKLLNRRVFLRGLGGAMVLAPVLESLSAALTKREARAAAGAGVRMIVMFTHYGCITTRFFPKKSHGELTAEDLEPTTLKHLVPYLDKLLMPRGIRAMNEWTKDVSRGQGNDPHTQVVGTYFTCQPVTPNTDNPFSFEQSGKFDAKPIGPSLDHVISQQLGAQGVPLYLRVGNFGENPSCAISYSAAETMHSGVGTLREAFNSISGLFGDGPLSPDSYAAVRGKSLIDLVQDDLETLERHDMSRADRLKLAAWKELLHETGSVVASAECARERAADFGLTEKNLGMAAPRDPDTDLLTFELTDSLDVADLYSNVAALAAACNAYPVTVLKYPANYVFRGLGIQGDSSGLSHRIGDAGMFGTCVADVIEMVHTIDDYYARKFAHLASRLDELGAFDQTMAVWFQEMSDGAAHNLNNIPIVQLGSAGGFFKTGCAINVEDGSDDLTSGNSEAFCAPGAPAEIDATAQATGTPPDVANAPINKYYVSLMNAMGVKGGEDGFPSKSGEREVTKFGRYDRTEDFVGGDKNPPFIHSPGGFDALRA